MNKLRKLIRGMGLLLKKPSLINLVTNSEHYWENYLKKYHNHQLQLPSIEILELIKDSSELNHMTFLGGGSMPTDIILLKSLAQQIPQCSYFEIGTWRGESVVNIAEVAAECYTLNLSKEEIISQGFSQNYANLHGVLSLGKEHITHLFGNTLTYNFESLNKKFDLIFIDGNHQYEFVKNDTQKVFAHLVHKDTIVVWHDYASHPEKSRAEVLAGILDGVPEDDKKHLYHVSNTLCAIYYPKEIHSRVLDFPVKPNKMFELKINSRKV